MGAGEKRPRQAASGSSMDEGQPPAKRKALEEEVMDDGDTLEMGSPSLISESNAASTETSMSLMDDILSDGETEVIAGDPVASSSAPSSSVSARRSGSSPVESLLSLVFDKRLECLQLHQLGIDLPQVELQTLTTETIQRANALLDEICRILAGTSDSNGKELLRLSYEYYCVLPTKERVPPYICSSAAVSTKRQVLKLLQSLPSHLLREAGGDKLAALGCTLSLLSSDSSDYKLLLSAVGATNWPRVSCLVKHVLAVSRPGDTPPSDEDRTLLFFGCHHNGVATTIRNSPQLSPGGTEWQPCGSAIYLTDMFSEALHDAKTFPIKDQTECIVLVCEVRKGSEMSATTRLLHRSTADTVKCAGSCFPHSGGTKQMSDGAYIATGPLVMQGLTSEFEFNRFCVFDPDRIRVRYAICVQFSASSEPEKEAEPKRLPFGAIVKEGKWLFAVGNDWKPYAPPENRILEDNYQRNQKFFHLTIAGRNYTVNLDHMRQFQSQNPKKLRKIKRV